MWVLLLPPKFKILYLSFVTVLVASLTLDFLQHTAVKADGTPNGKWFPPRIVHQQLKCYKCAAGLWRLVCNKHGELLSDFLIDSFCWIKYALFHSYSPINIFRWLNVSTCGEESPGGLEYHKPLFRTLYYTPAKLILKTQKNILRWLISSPVQIL